MNKKKHKLRGPAKFEGGNGDTFHSHVFCNFSQDYESECQGERK